MCAHIQHVIDGGAVLDGQIWHVEALACIPANLQLLFGPMQQVIQRLIVDLAVRGPAQIDMQQVSIWLSLHTTFWNGSVVVIGPSVRLTSECSSWLPSAGHHAGTAQRESLCHHLSHLHDTFCSDTTALRAIQAHPEVYFRLQESP